MWLCAALLLTILMSSYCATMAHQVLEEYNSLPTTQTTNRVPQNCQETT